MGLGFTTKSIDFSSPLKSGLSVNIGPLITKASLVNLDTNEAYKFLFNPSEVKRRPIKAIYEEVPVALRSHPKYQYKGTGAAEWEMSLYLSATSSNGQSVLNLISTSRNLNNDTAFLESLVYPLEASGLKNRRPPNVRFVWPMLANTKVVVLSVGSTYKKFNFRLQQQITMVDIVLAEDPEKTVTSNEVRQRGSTGRPGLLGAILDKLPKGVGDAVSKIDKWI